MQVNRGMIPGIFTMGNVVCGFFAILSAFDGKITAACWFVLLAGFLDVLDGKVARLSGSTSRFGVELDSLADFLSFGVAPAVIVYVIKLHELGEWRWILSVVYIIAAAYRLARFNVLAETDEKKDFMGLPVPMAAIGLVSFVIFCWAVWGKLEYSEWLITMIVLFAFLMVSQVAYDAFPDRFSTPRDRIKLAVLILAGVAIVIKPRLLLFPIVALYILYGMIIEGLRLFNAGVGRVTGRSFGSGKTRQIDSNDDQ